MSTMIATTQIATNYFRRSREICELSRTTNEKKLDSEKTRGQLLKSIAKLDEIKSLLKRDESIATPVSVFDRTKINEATAATINELLTSLVGMFRSQIIILTRALESGIPNTSPSASMVNEVIAALDGAACELEVENE
jgi:hypothetical protein